MRARERALVGAVVLVGVVSAVSLAVPIAPFLPRTWHRLLHVFGAVMFLGNVATGALWFTLATLTRSCRVLSFAIRVVNLADLVFTAPGALLLVVNGAVLAPTWGGVAHSPWLLLGTALFVACGVAWACVLVPIQVRLVGLLEQVPRDDDPVSVHPELPRRFAVYGVVGGVTGTAALVALFAMVTKLQ